MNNIVERSKARYNTTPWLRSVCELEARDRLVESSVETLTTYRKRRNFDAIACCGYSGLLLSTVLSYVMQIPLIVVRKTISHDSFMVFGMENATKYIIVDDFVSSGETVRRIHGWVSNFSNGKYNKACGLGNDTGQEPELLAVFTYDRDYNMGYEKTMSGYQYGLRIGGDSDPIGDVPLYDLRIGAK